MIAGERNARENQIGFVGIQIAMRYIGLAVVANRFAALKRKITQIGSEVRSINPARLLLRVAIVVCVAHIRILVHHSR